MKEKKFMKRIIALLLIAFSVVACKKDGESIKYYSNGNIREKITYKNWKRDKLFIYLEDGTISATQIFLNGKETGPVTYYYRNGNIESIWNYKDAKLHGETFLYYENGKIKEKRNYNNSEANGEYFKYDEQGNMTVHEIWENDKKIKTIK